MTVGAFLERAPCPDIPPAVVLAWRWRWAANPDRGPGRQTVCNAFARFVARACTRLLSFAAAQVDANPIFLHAGLGEVDVYRVKTRSGRVGL